MKTFIKLVLFSTVLLISVRGHAKSDDAAKKTMTKDQSAVLIPNAKASVLSTPIRKPASLDPNSAVEVRGQARTLSMMLVLKNGKDAINFIKVRKDYKPEIMKTEF